MMAFENIVDVVIMQNNPLVTGYYQLSKHSLVVYKILCVFWCSCQKILIGKLFFIYFKTLYKSFSVQCLTFPLKVLRVYRFLSVLLGSCVAVAVLEGSWAEPSRPGVSSPFSTSLCSEWREPETACLCSSSFTTFLEKHDIPSSVYHAAPHMQ